MPREREPGEGEIPVKVKIRYNRGQTPAQAMGQVERKLLRLWDDLRQGSDKVVTLVTHSLLDGRPSIEIKDAKGRGQVRSQSKGEIKKRAKRAKTKR